MDQTRTIGDGELPRRRTSDGSATPLRAAWLTGLLALLLHAAAGAALAGSPRTFVRMVFESGGEQTTVDVQLFDASAATTVANFLRQVEGHRYDASVVHQLIDGVQLQGGGFAIATVPPPVEICSCDPNPMEEEVCAPPAAADQLDFPAIDQVCLPEAPDPDDCPIADDYDDDRPNACGTLAMDKFLANSARTQWFFNLKDNTDRYGDERNPQGGFTVFGQIASCRPTVSGSDEYYCNVVAKDEVGGCSAAAGFMEPLVQMGALPVFDRPGACPGATLPAPTPDDICGGDAAVCESCRGCSELDSFAAAARLLPLHPDYTRADYQSYVPLEESHLLRLVSVEELMVAEDAVGVPEPSGAAPAALAAAVVLLLARRRVA